jgi:hypothetical protein
MLYLCERQVQRENYTNVNNVENITPSVFDKIELFEYLLKSLFSEREMVKFFSSISGLSKLRPAGQIGRAVHFFQTPERDQ